MKNTSIKLAAGAAAALSASAALAGGFQLTEQSALALGRAYAGVGVDGTDISGVYYNPATMTLHPGTNMQAGLVVVGLNLDYRDHPSAPSDAPQNENGRKRPGPLPHGFITHQINDSTWFGLGITIPFGLETEYSREWSHKDKGTEAKIMVIDINPNMAFKLSDKVSIGAGMSLQFANASVGLGGNAPTSLTSEGDTANVHGRLKVDNHAWGWNVGIMYTPVENVRFGLSYRSKVEHHASGTVNITGMENFTLDGIDVPVSALNGKYDSGTGMAAPQWIMANAAWDVNDMLSLYATFRWTDWSSFKSLKIDTSELQDKADAAIKHMTGTQPGQLTGTQATALQGVLDKVIGQMNTINNYWDDTYLGSIGADLRVNDFWTLRGGIAYETSPVGDKTNRLAIIPDADRWWFAIGSSFRWTKNFQTDIGFAHLHGVHERSLWDKQGNELGKYRHLDAYLVGVQAQYRF